MIFRTQEGQRACGRCPRALAPAVPRQIDVVPLMGESGFIGTYSQVNQIVLQAAESFRGNPHFLLTPMIVGSKKLRDDIMQDGEVREAVERWDRLTTAVIGIGVIPPQQGSIGLWKATRA